MPALGWQRRPLSFRAPPPLQGYQEVGIMPAKKRITLPYRQEAGNKNDEPVSPRSDIDMLVMSKWCSAFGGKHYGKKLILPLRILPTKNSVALTPPACLYHFQVMQMQTIHFLLLSSVLSVISLISPALWSSSTLKHNMQALPRCDIRIWALSHSVILGFGQNSTV